MGYNKKVLSEATKKLNKPSKKKVANNDLIPFVSTSGYKQGEPPAGTNYRIPSNTIYNPTPYNILAVASTGEERIIPAGDTSTQTFDGAEYVDEYELKKGGQKTNTKKYSRSLSATNKLFDKNPLFKKPKSKKKKIFDPNAKYYQIGGETDSWGRKSDSPWYGFDPDKKQFTTKDQWGRSPGDKWYGFNPDSKTWTKGTKAQQAVENKQSQEERYKTLYEPLENKFYESIETDDDFFSLPVNNQDFIGSLFIEDDKRNIPPADPVLKEMQKKLLDLENTELKKLMQKDYSDISLTNFGDYIPSNVSYKDALKYVNHIQKLKKQGYTFQDGGYLELDLTPKEIEQYKKDGYVVEELPKAQTGKVVRCPEGYTYDLKIKKCVSDYERVEYGYPEGTDIRDLHSVHDIWPTEYSREFTHINQPIYIKPIQQKDLVYGAGDYQTINIYPDINYKLAVDPSKAEGYDEATNTYYVPSENTHQYKKYKEWEKAKELEKQNLAVAQELVNTGKFKLEDINDELNKKVQENYANPAYIPEGLLPYDQFYKSGPKQRYESYLKTNCPECSFGHGESVYYDKDFVYRKTNPSLGGYESVNKSIKPIAKRIRENVEPSLVDIEKPEKKYRYGVWSISGGDNEQPAPEFPMSTPEQTNQPTESLKEKYAREREEYRQKNLQGQRQLQKGGIPRAQQGIFIDDPKEYKYRKAMYDDSLTLYNLQQDLLKKHNSAMIHGYNKYLNAYRNIHAPSSFFSLSPSAKDAYRKKEKEKQANLDKLYNEAEKKRQDAVSKFLSYNKKNPLNKADDYSITEHWLTGTAPGEKPILIKNNPSPLPYYEKPVQPVFQAPEIGTLPIRPLPQVQTPELIEGQKLAKPQRYQPIKTAKRMQTVMEPDPNKPGEYKIKDFRQVPYSAYFPGEGWQPMDAPGVAWINEKGEEVYEDPTRNKKNGGLTKAQKGGQYYTFQGTDYMKQDGKWFKKINGNYMPLTKGDVAKRSAVLDAQAHKLSPYELQQRARRQSGAPLYDPLQVAKPQVASTTQVIPSVPKKEFKSFEQKIADDKALAKYLTQTGKAELFLGDKYWNQKGDQPMEGMIWEEIRKDPDIMSKIDQKEYERWLEEEQKAYDKATPLQKGLNAASAFIGNPELVTQNLIFGSEETGLRRPLVQQHKILRDKEHPMHSVYSRATGHDDNWLDWGVNMFNPGAWAADAYVANEKGDYVDAYGNLLLNIAGGTGLSELAEQGAKQLPNAVKKLDYITKGVKKTYDKVATGNSFLTDYGLPAWKVERPAMGSRYSELNRPYIARTATDREAELYSKYGKGMDLSPEEWEEFTALTKSGITDFSKNDTPISRVIGYYDRGSDEQKAIEALKIGDVFNTPTEKSIRTWSAGVPDVSKSEYLKGKTRLIVPSRYTKNLGSDFAAMPYDDLRVGFIHQDPVTGMLPYFNFNASLENELMGNIPEGFKVIGRSSEDGMNNLIIKPIEKSNGYGSGFANSNLFNPKVVQATNPVKQLFSDIKGSFETAGKDIKHYINNYSNIKKAPSIYKDEIAKLLTPEGKQRLIDLGVDDIDDFMKYLDRAKVSTRRNLPTSALEVNRKGKLTPIVNLNFEQLNDVFESKKLSENRLRYIIAHELGHNIQGYLESIGKTYKGNTELDIKAVDELFPFATQEVKNFFKESTGLTDDQAWELIENASDADFNPIANAQYALRGEGKGKEIFPHLRELKQQMLQKGVIKNIHDNITIDDIQKFYSDFGGSKNRILSFIKKDGYEVLAKLLNKTPLLIPGIMGAGALGAAGRRGVVVLEV